MVVGCNNGVVGLTGFSNKRACGLLFGPQKSSRGELNRGQAIIQGEALVNKITRTQSLFL